MTAESRTIEHSFQVTMPDDYLFTKKDREYFIPPVEPGELQDDHFLDGILASVEGAMETLRELQHHFPDAKVPSELLAKAESLLKYLRTRRNPIYTGKITEAADRRLADDLNEFFDAKSYLFWSWYRARQAYLSHRD